MYNKKKDSGLSKTATCSLITYYPVIIFIQSMGTI